MKALLAIILMIPSALLAAAGPATTTTAPADPVAAEYRRAFAMIDKLNDADRKRIGLCGTDGCWVVTTPLDPSTGQMLTAQRETLELIRRVTGMNPPRWEFNGDAGKMVELSNHAPLLSSLLVLSARQELADGKTQQAVDDLVAALIVSRHTAAEPTLVGKMAETAAWRPVGELLAEKLPALPKELVATLPARIAELPKSPGTADVIRGEYAFAQQTAKKQGFAVVAMVAGLREFYSALLKGADLPPDEFDKLVDEQATKFAANPFTKLMAPQFNSLHRSVGMLETKQAMLEKAIAVVLNGETAAAPFVYAKTPKGFELSSDVTWKGKPVALRVGGE